MHIEKELPDLAVIGTGIRKLHQMTRESWALLENSEIVFSNLNDPAMAEALSAHLDAPVIDYSEMYNPFRMDDRYNTYYEIIHAPLEEAAQRDGLVSYITVGHPSIWAYTPLNTKLIGEKYWDLDVELYAGVSASAEIYALLNLDPARNGAQEMAMSTAIRRNIKLNPELTFFGWLFGQISNELAEDFEDPMQSACNYLCDQFGPKRQAHMVRASKSPLNNAAVRTIRLEDIANINPKDTYGTTLIIPGRDEDVDPDPIFPPRFSDEQIRNLKTATIRDDRNMPEPLTPFLEEIGKDDLLEVIRRIYFDDEFFHAIRENPEETLEPYDITDREYEIITGQTMQKGSYTISRLIKELATEHEESAEQSNNE